jgi:hypothetical protein
MKRKPRDISKYKFYSDPNIFLVGDLFFAISKEQPLIDKTHNRIRLKKNAKCIIDKETSEEEIKKIKPIADSLNFKLISSKYVGLSKNIGRICCIHSKTDFDYKNYKKCADAHRMEFCIDRIDDKPAVSFIQDFVFIDDMVRAEQKFSVV